MTLRKEGAKTSLVPDPSANVKNSPNGILGVNAILISVKDLDVALAFYQAATPFELIKREQIQNDAASDRLFCTTGAEMKRAVLRAPNMLLELLEFSENRDRATSKMPIQGPGMTHTCYQTPAEQSGYQAFRSAGAGILTSGESPVDLGGYGVTYAYAHDPHGNMLEMEQLDQPVLEHTGYYQSPVLKNQAMWITQVCLVSPDIERLLAFYAEVLGISPSRRVEVKNNAKAAAIGGVESLHILGAWFQLDEHSKVLELWQYLDPKTPAERLDRTPSTLGYSFAIEVNDVLAELQRIQAIEGLHLFGEPVEFDDFIGVYGCDIDGNVFCLRQMLDPASPHSVRALDQ